MAETNRPARGALFAIGYGYVGRWGVDAMAAWHISGILSSDVPVTFFMPYGG